MTVAAPEPTTFLNGETRVVLQPVSWWLYQQILRELGDNRGSRLAYDDGRLEIMSPSAVHADVTKTISRLIEAYADAAGIDIEGYGSMTMDREALKKGIEPDECYYVQNVPTITDERGVDVTTDPPPDLVIEVAICRFALPKQPIYPALGVPEIWRYDGKRFSILRRTASGGYEPAEQSGCFPGLPIDEVNRFVEISLASGQSAAVRALRQWLNARGLR